jgi:sugar lactone lactonase YvrE
MKKERKMKKSLALFLLLAVTACATVDGSEQGSRGEPGSSLVIELSGENYYPDSIAARKDGTLFVGSMWTGQIDRIPSDANRPVSFVPPEADGRTALGLLVDEDADRLWACYWDFHRFMTVPAQLKSFDLETGDLKEAYDYPDGSICNDLTMDGDGNIYTTCSFTHRIFRLPAGGNALEIWSDDPVLAADWQDGWTLNGIEWDGDASIYVSRTDNDGFYRVSIENDGSAGAVQQIAVADTLTNMGYDGIVALDSDTFLVAEYSTNRLTMIDVTGNNGTKQVVSTGLDFPTNATVVGDGAWVVESQIDHMLYPDAAGPPQAPFLLKHVSLPQY